MDTTKIKRFAVEARRVLLQGVSLRFTALGFRPDGSTVEEPVAVDGGAVFMGDVVSEDFYSKWNSLQTAVKAKDIKTVAEEAAYTWFNRLIAIRILTKNGLSSPVLTYESDDSRLPVLVSEARQGRIPQMDEQARAKFNVLLEDDSKTNEQFAMLIVAYCHTTPIINKCFGKIADYTELLLPQNILAENGFVNMLNDNDFISDEDY
ncbi:type II restriction enzyme, partial [gut metagenome]